MKKAEHPRKKIAPPGSPGVRVAAALVEHLSTRRMTTRQVARDLGVSPSYGHDLLNGHIAEPSSTVIAKVAALTGKAATWLACGDDLFSGTTPVSVPNASSANAGLGPMIELVELTPEMALADDPIARFLRAIPDIEGSWEALTRYEETHRLAFFARRLVNELSARTMKIST